MANINNTTAAHEHRHSEAFPSVNYDPNAGFMHFPLANLVSLLDCNALTEAEALQLLDCCDESVAGLCQTLHFLGNTLAMADRMEFESKCLMQAGHSLSAISDLIPAIMQLREKTETRLTILL